MTHGSKGADPTNAELTPQTYILGQPPNRFKLCKHRIRMARVRGHDMEKAENRCSEAEYYELGKNSEEICVDVVLGKE